MGQATPNPHRSCRQQYRVAFQATGFGFMVWRPERYASSLRVIVTRCALSLRVWLSSNQPVVGHANERDVRDLASVFTQFDGLEMILQKGNMVG
jgi:hypothetical protein